MQEAEDGREIEINCLGDWYRSGLLPAIGCNISLWLFYTDYWSLPAEFKFQMVRTLLAQLFHLKY